MREGSKSYLQPSYERRFLAAETQKLSYVGGMVKRSVLLVLREQTV
jgi:hypothetical protein